MGTMCSCNKNNIDFNDNIFKRPNLIYKEETQNEGDIDLKAKSSNDKKAKHLSTAADYIFNSISKLKNIQVKQPKEAVEAEAIENEIKNSFLINYQEIKELCGLHFIDPLYNSFLDIEYITNHAEEGKKLLFRDKKAKKRLKFFKENLLMCLRKNQDFINLFLKHLFTEFLDSNKKSKEDFFKILINEEETKINNVNDSSHSNEEEDQNENKGTESSGEQVTKINIIGFLNKRYFFENIKKNQNLRKNSRENNIENSREKSKIFVLNMNPELIKNKIFLGVQILENGKLFAGKFSPEGLIEERGIYIDKKGNLFLGQFANNEMLCATVYGPHGSIYEGRIMKMRKHGLNQIENTMNYEFVGNFENGKKIKGVYWPKDGENCVKSIEVDEENLRQIKKLSYTKNVEYAVKYELRLNNRDQNSINYLENERTAIFKGKVNKNKINDPNGILQFDSKSPYPCYQGEIRDNVKEGVGKYMWNENDYYHGCFMDNLFHKTTNRLRSFDDLNSKNKNANLLRNYGRSFEVTCEKGKIVKFKEI